MAFDGLGFQPHAWQTACVKTLIEILPQDGYAYLQAPTGVGKTFAMLMLGERLPINGARVIIVGTVKIARQHAKVMREQGFKDHGDGFTSPSGHRWIISTWQGLYLRDGIGMRCALLFFDECHLGGSHAHNLSYPAIVAKLRPAMRVQVSATTLIASERLLGQRKDHSFVYTMSQAYEDALLNPVEIIEIETGTKTMVERVEKSLGKPMDDLQELTDVSLTALAKKMKAMEVLAPHPRRVPSGRWQIEADRAARLIIDHRHDAMIDLYLARHTGKAAIFWCPNIDAAQRAAQRFAHRSNLPSAAVHNAAGEVLELIEAFECGDLTVIFAVNMLQEGFDMPSLALSFDCRFHRQLDRRRVARMLQRIGRSTRKLPGKGMSQYYVAADLTHYYDGFPIPEGSLIAAHILAAGDVINTGDIFAEVPLFEAREETIDVDTEWDEDWDTDESGDAWPVGPDGKPERRKIKLKSAPLYVIRAVRDYRQTHSIALARLWNDEVALGKRHLLDMAKAGKPVPPPRNPWRERLVTWMRRDAAFKAAILDANPGWTIAPKKPHLDTIVLTRSQTASAKAAMLEQARKGAPKPQVNTTEYGRLCRWAKGDLAWAAAIAQAGWTLKPSGGKSRQSLAVDKANIIERAKRGEPRPLMSKEPSLANRIIKWMHHDPAFRDAVLAANPTWRIGHSDITRAQCLEMARAGHAPLDRTTPDGKKFRHWVYRDAEFENAMRVANPDWLAFRRKEQKRPRRGIRGNAPPTTRPILTPAGKFASAELAAKHFGMTRQMARMRADRGSDGWGWE